MPGTGDESLKEAKALPPGSLHFSGRPCRAVRRSERSAQPQMLTVYLGSRMRSVGQARAAEGRRLWLLFNSPLGYFLMNFRERGRREEGRRNGDLKEKHVWVT